MTQTNTVVNGSIHPQAQSFVISVDVQNDAFTKKCDEYWESVKDVIPADLAKKAKKGFRTLDRKKVVHHAGGTTQFYRPVIVDMVMSFAAGKGKNVLAVSSIECVPAVDNTTLKASVFFEPDVSWGDNSPPGLSSLIPVVLPAISDDTIASGVAQQQQIARTSNVILTPIESVDGTPVTAADGTIVVIDAESLIDGKPWAPGCVTNNKWEVSKTGFKNEEMYTNLLGIAVGEMRRFTMTLNDKFGEEAGKVVHLSVRASQIYKKTLPDINDDLAKTVGFDNLDAWNKYLTTQVKTRQETQVRESTESQAIAALLQAVTVGPLPTIWIAYKAEEIYSQQRGLVRTEEELFTRFAPATPGVKVNKDSLLNYFGNEAARSLTYDLVLRSWGLAAKVPGDTSLEKIGKYVDAVKQELVKHTVATTPEAK